MKRPIGIYFSHNTSEDVIHQMSSKWQAAIPQEYLLWDKKDSVHVDLGCGSLPRNPLGARMVIGVDIISGLPFAVREGSLDYLQVIPGMELPIETNHVDSVSAYDFLEHVPRVDRLPNGEISNPFITIMNEIHRILKPGGLLIALTPCYPSPAAFTDPTHVNFITEETHLYFSGPNFARNKGYGFNGHFNVLECTWSDWKGVLWDTHADSKENNLQPSIFTAGLGLKSTLKQIKYRTKRKITGHTGETHFLWVLEKPRD